MRRWIGFSLLLTGIPVAIWACRVEPDSAGPPSTWTIAKPRASKNPVKVKTAGKTLSYDALTPGHPVEVQVEGPSRLRAVTRLRFDQDRGSEQAYEFRVFIDSTDRRTYRKTARRSVLSQFSRRSNHPLGKIRNVHLDVPDGTHTYRFELSPESRQTVLLRFLVQKTPSKQAWVYLSPMAFPSMTVLELDGNERTYFPVTQKDSPTLEVVGPAQLKILTRWQSFEPALRRAQVHLHLFQDAVLQSTKRLVSNRASGKVISLEQLSAIGSSHSFLLEVPGGKHRYTFRLMDSPRIAAVLIRPFLHVGKRSEGPPSKTGRGR